MCAYAHLSVRRLFCPNGSGGRHCSDRGRDDVFGAITSTTPFWPSPRPLPSRRGRKQALSALPPVYRRNGERARQEAHYFPCYTRFLDITFSTWAIMPLNAPIRASRAPLTNCRIRSAQTSSPVVKVPSAESEMQSAESFIGRACPPCSG